MPKKLDHVDAMFKYMKQYPGEEPGGAMWQRFQHQVLEPRHAHLLADLTAHAEPEDCRRINDACRMFKGHIVRLLAVAVLLGALALPAAAAGRPQNTSKPPVIGTYAGTASYYTPADSSQRTACGDRFIGRDLTAAAWWVPCGASVRVTNTENGIAVVVRINDVGPRLDLYFSGRIIDLTQSAFEKIAPLSQGIANVTVEVL